MTLGQKTFLRWLLNELEVIVAGVSCNHIIYTGRAVDRVLYHQIPAVNHAAGRAGPDHLHRLLHQHRMGAVYSDIFHAAVPGNYDG